MCSWCLVLVLWGDKYSADYVNALVRSVLAKSSTCVKVALITDRIRPSVDAMVVQHLIPEFFHQPDFFRGGYVVKLSMFHRPFLPKNLPCVFLDLDTVVVGDIGKIAALVRNENDYLMLPPGNIVGFGPVRRLVWKLSGGEMVCDRKFLDSGISLGGGAQLGRAVSDPIQTWRT